MPALPGYIPSKDADLANWADNFSTLLTAAPTTYGLVTGDATAVATVVNAFLAAYSTAINPSTKTPVTVAAKDVAKIDMLTTVRPYAINISLNPGVLVDDKIAIGVNPRTSTPTPIAAPTTSPVVTLVSAQPYQHVCRFRDETSSPSVKAKPYGVTQIQIFAKASATPITDPELLNFIGVRTKAPTLITWEVADVGKQAYYAARWQTRAGLVGPWSPMVNFTVAG